MPNTGGMFVSVICVQRHKVMPERDIFVNIFAQQTCLHHFCVPECASLCLWASLFQAYTNIYTSTLSAKDANLIAPWTRAFGAVAVAPRADEVCVWVLARYRTRTRVADRVSSLLEQ